MSVIKANIMDREVIETDLFQLMPVPKTTSTAFCENYIWICNHVW